MRRWLGWFVRLVARTIIRLGFPMCLAAAAWTLALGNVDRGLLWLILAVLLLFAAEDREAVGW